MAVYKVYKEKVERPTACQLMIVNERSDALSYVCPFQKRRSLFCCADRSKGQSSLRQVCVHIQGFNRRSIQEVPSVYAASRVKVKKDQNRKQFDRVFFKP